MDVLNLTVGTVRFLDLKNLSRNREFKPDLRNQVFKDVKTAADLHGILIMIWLRSGGGSFGHYDGTNCRPVPSFPLAARALRESITAVQREGFCPAT